MQQLREKAGLLEAAWLCAAAKSRQVWLEGISLVFLTTIFLEMILMVTP